VEGGLDMSTSLYKDTKYAQLHFIRIFGKIGTQSLHN